ncbi:putative divergent CRAL/TRIO domain containing protein [Lyophyllum shimeji]|uniref:Divergent CRAL/TRIO domain containing protein n=1 Tax=Lyophyllum shimeji TaxID=47721 RepID=A0A9P3UHS0_LYOSH|nr:putative divergent CRAL/TRIO domain containing protein [Lyophyllum shimeji]
MPPINLKQRLAALSISPSSPTPPHGQGPRSPMAALKRKATFIPPWVKRPQHEHNLGGEESVMLQEVMAKMIFQAGVDFETRPMVVLNASALPDPREVSYDLLLSRILSYLDLYVESDYTVVFFAAGGRHTPGWNWVWKAYRSLRRKYRKNLKQLYIVHSSFFSKMLFSLAGAIISPKFFRKLVYLDTLSELATLVPLTQIDIPPAVYQENLKFEKQITLPTPIRSNIFGVLLEDLMGYEGEKGGLPRVVKDSIQFLRERGLSEEGLFRRSPPSAMLRAAQDAYDRGNVVSLDTFGDPHLAAVLLKKYLRDLPEPIFPEKLYPLIRRCPPPTKDPSDVTSITYIRETLLPTIPPCAYILLNQVLHLLHEVSLRAASNRMDAHNLAIVICPNLVKGSNPVRDVMMCAVPGAPAILESNAPSRSTPVASAEGGATLGMVIQICIQRYYEVFDEVWDRSEALPPSRSYQDPTAVSSERSSASASPQPAHNDDDEEDDDAMLVMPIGPGHSNGIGNGNGASRPSPPSAWTVSAAANGSSTYKPQHRSNLSGGSSSRVRSVHTAFGDSGSVGGYAYPTMGKAKSMISIENGMGTAGGRRGSISVGRGTTRKSSGAAVEAISITAEGFFAPPSTAPPVPSRKPNGAP